MGRRVEVYDMGEIVEKGMDTAGLRMEDVALLSEAIALAVLKEREEVEEEEEKQRSKEKKKREEKKKKKSEKDFKKRKFKRADDWRRKGR
ncbi:uncharacterized protein MONOS_6299 [Monocercomonoides exilis]|uniref:uncharacterized protein n=1 Tax=Monocercomonoides exilis TaxID=2049356 RepID=UPI00355AB0F4|nr:hypothetical protein MONOS_6299 [Monocercomonoides exilis]|eukprot:MONOS_6299.1-p1 / transcript=MONOS_6299.1 / gene=MONOS_6299 / organism=Monocercomonoides_exilis_PA203 / gene_product=unspecified product / transcript_product=unspecified product / location=Mono_scaffold00196:70369-70638(-) / protein_length=90 / sequence_SO=supercontig / SO=protein_coding / is_pseudo=false